MDTTHYTLFGAQIQPPCADGLGYIEYRKSVVERLKSGEDVESATDGERWIARQELRIEEWRVNNA